MPYDYGFQSQSANQTVLQQQFNSRNGAAGGGGAGSLTPTSSFFNQNFNAATSSQPPSQPRNDPNRVQQSNQYPVATSQPPSTSASAVASTSAVPYAAPSVPAPVPPTAAKSGTAPSTYETDSPVYAPYGSSVISVNQNSNTAYKLPPLAMHLPPAQPASSPFNPTALGLPAPPPSGQSNNFAGLYSTSGFDLLGVLARVAARPNPQIQIGPVDSSCAFAVVDARRWDQPLVFASDTFVKMTGYTNEEIVGRNCA